MTENGGVSSVPSDGRTSTGRTRVVAHRPLAQRHPTERDRWAYESHQARHVALDETTRALLAARYEHQATLAKQVGVDLSADPYLLSRSADGSFPCLPDGLSHGYERLAKRLGIKGHIHELRHFSAATTIAGGADVRTVAGRLGHTDASVTLRVCTRAALEARDRELAGMLGRAVLGPMNGSSQLDKANPPAPPQLEGAR